AGKTTEYTMVGRRSADRKTLGKAFQGFTKGIRISRAHDGALELSFRLSSQTQCARSMLGGHQSMKPDVTPQAVALEYDGKNAPRLTAKGEGELALEIIALAKQHGIHLHQDATLTEYLASLELNSEIPRELYLVIARIIA